MEELVARKYRIQKKIGEGKFGIVFSGLHERTKEHVAIKLEESRTAFKLLKNETSIMKYLYDHGCRNIPIVFWYGIYKDYMGLVMPLYDCSLHEYIKSKEMPPNKIAATMVYAISILKSIHKHYVLHRDIKPHNFMLKDGELYLIDFGMSSFYIDDTNAHLADGGPKNEHIIGNPKYASYNIHEGYALSRRDDMISLGYMYLFLLYRELPWDTLDPDPNEEFLPESHILHYKNKQRRDRKKWSQLEPILSFKKEINQIALNYLNYCYHLAYQDTPNYDELINIFSSSQESRPVPQDQQEQARDQR
jgi:serine/threonine protein kinase